MRSIEKVFTVAVPVERAWAAFADGAERSKWEASTYEIDPRPGGAVHWTLPGHDTVGRVEEVVPLERLRQVDLDGPHASAEITVTFEDLGTSTRITITHAGFGDGWDEWLEGTSIGWTQAIADLVVYLETGVVVRRFNVAMQSPGMTMRDEPGGVRVERTFPGGLAEGAGIREGDLLVRLAGVPVFTITDVWVLMRQHGVGDACVVEYVRGDSLLSGEGTVTSWDVMRAA
jgi:uncharacterized protein YndB with AHSA1/START domain